MFSGGVVERSSCVGWYNTRLVWVPYNAQADGTANLGRYVSHGMIMYVS